MPEFNSVLRSEMTDKQRDAVIMFEQGRFMYGEKVYEIHTLTDLHKANSWVLWQCRDDYRPGVIASIQHSFIVPAFKRMAFGIVIAGGDVSDLDGRFEVVNANK